MAPQGPFVSHATPFVIISVVHVQGHEGLQWWLAIVLSCHVFEGGKPIAPRHVLLELLLQGLEADPILLIGTELGDVEAWCMRHVDHVGIGQNHKLVLLQRDKSKNNLVSTA